MDSLGIVVRQVDAERRAAGKEQGQVLIEIKVSIKQSFCFCLPIRMSNENILPACIFLEDICDLLAQGVESIRSSDLWG